MLEVLTKGSVTWANDPNGPDAPARYGDDYRAIRKYATDIPRHRTRSNAVFAAL
ncbi:hypothetical protein [Dactylosporangium sp. CA-092794]|uniref:hypothetical protein n=1 Tax=Dactylosporangium sp. CA-092794 TaxID=3239929 RepID=UPI003D8BBF56